MRAVPSVLPDKGVVPTLTVVVPEPLPFHGRSVPPRFATAAPGATTVRASKLIRISSVRLIERPPRQRRSDRHIPETCSSEAQRIERAQHFGLFVQVTPLPPGLPSADGERRASAAASRRSSATRRSQSWATFSAGSSTRRCSAPPSRICPLWLVGGAESDHSYADGVGPDSVRHRLLAGDGCHAVYRCGDGSQAWAERLGAAAGLAAKLRHEGVARTGDGGVVARPAGAASKRGHRYVRTHASVRRTSGGHRRPAPAACPTAKRFLDGRDPEPLTFEDLPGKWQAAILEAEQNRPELRVVTSD